MLAIGIKVLLGDFYTDKAKLLADLIKNYGANELRFSLRQDISLLRNIKEENLAILLPRIKAKLDMVALGYDTIAEISRLVLEQILVILGIASSTGIAR